jgi:hypothetical protein
MNKVSRSISLVLAVFSASMVGMYCFFPFLTGGEVYTVKAGLEWMIPMFLVIMMASWSHLFLSIGREEGRYHERLNKNP